MIIYPILLIVFLVCVACVLLRLYQWASKMYERTDSFAAVYLVSIIATVVLVGIIWFFIL